MNNESRFEPEEAIYTEQVLPEFNSNPLIKALPPMMSFQEAVKHLQYYPDFNESERLLEPHFRLECVKRLCNFFQPWDIHLKIENKISSAIRQGYISRNPIKPAYAADMHQLYKALKEKDSRFEGVNLSPSSASGFTIIGYSGVGKSRAIEKILALYPRVIVHNLYEDQPLQHYQLVWMKLECPLDGSIKGLCSSFFMQFDELLGENTYNKFASGHNTTTDLMIPRMAQLAKRQSLGLLVIDEIQHLSAAKSRGSEKMLNFFVNLVNTIGVPIILIGTNKALPILQGEFRQARRSTGQQGSVIWENMKKNEWWDLLLKGFWKFQWSKDSIPLTEGMSDLFYELSQGIVDVTVKLFILSQVEAIISGKEKLTPSVVRSASRESLSFLEPMLKAIKSGDYRTISNFEDLLPLDINKLCENRINSTASQIILTDNIKSRGSINKNRNCKTSKEKQIKAYDNSNPINKSPKIDNNDLRIIIKQAKKEGLSAYEALKQAGFIKDPVKEFIKAG